MTLRRWFRGRSDPRGSGALAARFGGRRLALVLLALAGLIQSGCQSCGGGCGPSLCGPCGWFRNLRERVFRPRAMAGGCCGSDVISDGLPVDSGAVPAVVAPPAAVVPPAGKTTPEILENIPSATPGPSGTSGSRSSAGKASYEVYRPRNRYGRSSSNGLARSFDPAPATTNRSAQESVSSPPPPAAEASPLDNIPPLELPKEKAAEATASPPAAAAPDDAKTSANATDRAPSAANAAPGLRRFVPLEPKLAGGSLPTKDGLDWLVEKGYKTLLDLREPSQVEATFLADVTSRGLRYVSLPVSAKTLDADHVSRFLFELSLADARPLYFCDADGTRAGALWYIRRISVDKVDAQLASREAEELGLSDKSFWLAASNYLDSLKAPRTPDATPASATVPDREKPPAPAEPERKPAATVAPEAASQVDPEVEKAEAPAPVTARDPSAWRSYAALVLTSLGVPLAYVSRAAIPSWKSWSRASLPGPGPRPRSLPGASGE